MCALKLLPDPNRFVLVDINRLRVGGTLTHSILENTDDRQVVLVGSGVTLTPEHLANLNRRGLTHVRVNRSDLGQVLGPEYAERIRIAYSQTDPAASGATNRRTPQPAGRVRPMDRQMLQRFMDSDRAAVQQLDDLFKGIERGDLSHADQLREVSQGQVAQFETNREAFLFSSILPGSEFSFSHHSHQVSKLAVAIADSMNRTADEIAELNVGCLIHDIGMQRIDQDLVQLPRSLTEVEYLEITKHPAITFELIRNVRSLSTGSRMVAYQMHERMNASGYPRNRRGEQIHPLARIASVADVYVALVSQRPYRAAMLPYTAMELLIRSSRSGLFDPLVVRALLQTVSMFPIGSYVELSDGRVGQVLRANSEHYTAPVVQVCDGAATDDPTIVDLSEEPELSITRPLAEAPQEPVEEVATSDVAATADPSWE